MNDIVSGVLSVSVSAVISIVGFIITIFTLKRNFQNELAKQKANVQLEKMSEIPYEILILLQDIIDSGKGNFTSDAQQRIKQKMDWIFSSIYAYGSTKSIQILAAMQSENYQNAVTPELTDNFRMMTYYVLLTVQIRSDITGEIVSPEAWFKLKITDYATNREKIKTANNQLVNELSLNKQYMMK